MSGGAETEMEECGALLRQMAGLSLSASRIFARLQGEVEHLSGRSEALQGRLNRLQHAVHRLPDPRSLISNSGKGIKSVPQPRAHYQQRCQLDIRLFTPLSRPHTPPPPLPPHRHESAGTQTEDLPPPTSTPLPSKEIAGNEEGSPAKRQATHTSCIVRINTSSVIQHYDFSANQRRQNACYSTRSMDRRLSRKQKTERRRTVALVPDDLKEESERQNDGVDPLSQNFAPSEIPDLFPLRPRKRNPTIPNVFASLRRKKTPSKTITKVEDPKTMRNAAEQLRSPIETLSNVIKSSLSLRRPSKKNLTGSPPCIEGRRPIGPPRVGPAKMSLPISTASQVLSLASIMRNDPLVGRRSGAKESPLPSPRYRPRSGPSFASNGSLNLLESGCYREGYQLDFPEDCALRPIREERKSPEPFQSQPGTQMEGSTYSCDVEGYFTSMHRDSGLEMGGGAGRGRVEVGDPDRSDGSSTTLASSGGGNEVRAEKGSSADSGAEDLQSPGGEAEYLRNLRARCEKLSTLPAHKAFPPLCEISGSGNDSESDSPSTLDVSLETKSGYSTVPRNFKTSFTRMIEEVPTSDDVQIQCESKSREMDDLEEITANAAPPSDDPLDRWLIHKFHAEMSLKTQSPLTSTQTITRPNTP